MSATMSALSMVLSFRIATSCTKDVVCVTCIKVYNRTVSSNALLNLLNLVVCNFLMMLLQVLSGLVGLPSFLVQGKVSSLCAHFFAFSAMMTVGQNPSLTSSRKLSIPFFADVGRRRGALLLPMAHPYSTPPPANSQWNFGE